MKKLVIGLVALVVVAVAGWLVYDNVFASEAADEFTLEDEAAEAAPDDEPAGTAEGDGTDLSGSWQAVAPSEAGYRIVEDGVLGEKVVTGRTTSVTGTVVLSASSLESTDITVDMASVSSDEPLRDTAFRETLLDTAQHPSAQFVQDEPVELERAAPGTSLAVDVPGTLLLKGVQQPVVASIEGIETDGTITIVGTIEVQLADFGIDPPSIPNVLTARDTALVEFKLVLERG